MPVHLAEQEGQFAAMARLLPMLAQEAFGFPSAPLQARFKAGQRGHKRARCADSFVAGLELDSVVVGFGMVRRPS